MEKFKELKKLLDQTEPDAKKFYDSNNGAAGTRLRKAMLALKNLSQEIRKEVSEKKQEAKPEKV